MATEKGNWFPYIIYEVEIVLNKAVFAIVVESENSWRVFSINGEETDDSYWPSDMADPRKAMRYLKRSSQPRRALSTHTIKNVTEREKKIIIDEILSDEKDYPKTMTEPQK
jgi:hypothetical protein